MTRIVRGVSPLRAALLAATLLIPASALGQTPMGGMVSTSPPGQNSQRPFQGTQSQPMARSQPGQAQTQPQAQAQPVQPIVPMSDEVVAQATRQSEGLFPPMDRVGAGGQIQEAWNFTEAREGVYTTRLCENCVYKVRTREFMTTTIMLPEDAQIVTADLGDPTGFNVQIRAGNMIAIRPAAYGLDTNLNVYTKSGAIYPFYVRSEGFNSIHVPDMVVKILGRETPAKIEPTGETAAIGGDARGEKGAVPAAALAGSPAAQAVHDLTNPKPPEGDFVRTVPFDPSQLHGWNDYRLWGGGDAKTELKPKVVYRDAFFTYLQYGENFDPLELPTAYVVRDGIDELVNSRVQGNTFIIESTSKLITLKNGKSFLCLEYRGS